MSPVVSMRQLAMGALLAGFAHLALAGAENSSLNYFGAPPGTLARVKARVKAGDKTLTPALDALIADAERALLADPPSVMDKTRLPPTGDRHDYMSTAPYFWPDPARSNGLPYIRHDGKVNPESRGPASDHDRLGRMGATVQTLALAYYLTGREAYATQAARFLRVWFLEPATRMKPNLDFAQGVPGASTGRGFGVLEGRSIAEAADAAQLLTGSGAWKAKDDKAFRSWLGAFLDWLLTSRNGRTEAAARNNHGTFYDVQVLRLALVLGRDSLAKSIASAAGPKRIAAQIEPDGRQPLELQRTAALGYSAFNLQALFALARICRHRPVALPNIRRPQHPQGA